MKLCIIIFGIFTVIANVGAAGYNGPTNQAGLDLIKEFEGWYPNFYNDPVGIRTIGYGHACHVWDCSIPLNGIYRVPLTKSDGQALLKSDLVAPGRYEKCVANAVTANINSNQFSALVSFVFNLGCSKFKSSNLLQLLNAGNVKGASLEFPKWNKAGGSVLRGLVRRREAERSLFCTGGICENACVGSVRASTLIIRSSPTSASSNVGSLSNGETVTILSRVSGENINGNSNWFNVSNGYVSSFYITIITSDNSWCKSES